ncbi:MAG: hypothetical protein MUF38_13360 [Anaerolineae bacterium]|jgi:hypothetical protein|nr:hypothetical protein [Anaerolineae bacterium]
MPQFDIDPDALAEQIETRLKRQNRVMRGVFFGVNTGMFVLFNVLAWSFVGGAGIDALGESAVGSVWGALFLMAVGWGVGLIYQLITLLVENPRAQDQMRAQIASRLVGEQVFQQAMRRTKTKAKRGGVSDHDDLIDDPEGLYEAESDTDADAPVQRSRR